MNQVETVTHKAILQMLKRFNNGLSKHQMESEEKLSQWAEYLQTKRFTVEEVGKALAQIGSTAFMPSSFEIASKIKEMRSPKVNTALLENEIVEFVRLHSYDLEGNYFHTLSEAARKVINSMGGTREIRNSNPDFIGRRISKAFEDIKEGYENISIEYRGGRSSTYGAIDFKNIAGAITSEANPA